MLCACIDIGSNTTRVLVADVKDGLLREVLQQRAFTRIGKGLKGGEIPRDKIAEVACVVAAQRAIVEQLGCVKLRVVATAAIDRISGTAAVAAATFVTLRPKSRRDMPFFFGFMLSKSSQRSSSSIAWVT